MYLGSVFSDCGKNLYFSQFLFQTNYFRVFSVFRVK